MGNYEDYKRDVQASNERVLNKYEPPSPPDIYFDCYGCGGRVHERVCYFINDIDETYCETCYQEILDQGDLAADALMEREWNDEEA